MAAKSLPLSHGRRKSGATTHGECHKTPEHHSWSAMLARCERPSHHAFKNYGGRGIKVCARWRGSDGYVNFLADMGRKPTPAHTLDRVDNDKGYDPANCRWATRSEQIRNRRITRMVVYDGRVVSLADAADLAGISRKAVEMRIRAGWPETEWFKPKKAGLTVMCRGARMTLAEAARVTGVPDTVIYKRLKRGWSDQDAVRGA